MEKSLLVTRTSANRKKSLCKSRSSYLHRDRSISPSPSFIKKVNHRDFLPVIRNIRQEELQWEIKICRWRSETDYPLFKIYDYKSRGLQKVHTLELRCQLPNKKISLMKSISLENALYILKSIAFGVQKLLEMFEPFKITEKMVGLDRQNVCKIWVNERFEENQIMERQRDEGQMVRKLANIILPKLRDNESLKNQLKQTLGRCQKFTELGDELWKFSYTHQIMIPPVYINNSENVSTSRLKESVKCSNSRLDLSASKNRQQENTKQQNRQIRDRKSFLDLINISDRRHSNITRYNDRRRSIQIKKNYEPLPPKKQKTQKKLIDKQNMKPLVQKLAKSDNYNDKNAKTDKCNKTTEQIPQKSTKASQTTKSQFFSEKQSQIMRNSQINAKFQAMKSLIKTRLNKNPNSFKVVYLDACGTVKSIGQFLQTERDLEAEEKEVKILKSMGREVYQSMIDED